ncbi:TIGR02444 family protein [Pseudomonas cavernae]|uniref:TIGR02444 family protein n=1 Tax=Pseudomonas cavernae TaxID=2320867 RepID=A0A385Z642_9PSED|nr:TIGR02444 family protein [Pseudomonas cavernae]AYC34779.1 TIGR02444 family protein [Pseudomonas cavernae]
MPSDLWSFAIHFYARAGVEAACLQLQTAGADVCLLLAGAWLTQRGVACSDERLQHLRSLAEPWQRQVVTPLRQVRQAWRPLAAADAGLHGLREQLKALELAAERQLLLKLESSAQDWPTGADTEASAWLECLAGRAGELHHGALQVLRAAVGTG